MTKPDGADASHRPDHARERLEEFLLQRLPQGVPADPVVLPDDPLAARSVEDDSGQDAVQRLNADARKGGEPKDAPRSNEDDEKGPA